MKKNILLLLLLFATGMAAHAQQYALVDMEYILKNIPDYQNANEQLNRVSKQWQAEVEKLSEAARTLYEAYQAGSKDLSAAQMKQKEDEIVEKEKAAADLRRKYFGPEGELAKMRDELLGPIEDDIYEAVKAISLQEGYGLVIDRASAASIIFASPSIDISDEVLARMGY